MVPNNIFYRKLNAQDAPLFCRIRAESIIQAPEMYKLTPREVGEISHQEAGAILDSKMHVVMGAFLGEELIAIRWFSAFRQEKLSHRGFLWELFYKEGHEDGVLGLELTRQTIDCVKQTVPAIEQIRVAIVTSNKTSQDIIQSLRFKKLWTEKQAFKYNGTYYELYHFVKYLRDCSSNKTE